MHTFDALDAASLRSDIPEFRAGDTLKVHVKVVEGTRSRVQVFQGVVIRRHGGGIGETFTVRKISFGVGVERTFPLHTPIIDKIEVVTRGDVRRAKLYYLRGLRGKAAKIREKRDTVPAQGRAPRADDLQRSRPRQWRREARWTPSRAAPGDAGDAHRYRVPPRLPRRPGMPLELTYKRPRSRPLAPTGACGGCSDPPWRCCSCSCVRAFFVTPFGIPSGSMQDTLLSATGSSSAARPRPSELRARRHRRLRRVPGLQPEVPERGLLQTLVAAVESLVGRGQPTDYVKRVIGLPGDHVRCCAPDGRLEVNGVAVDRAVPQVRAEAERR